MYWHVGFQVGDQEAVLRIAFLEAFYRGLSRGNTFASFCVTLTQNSVLVIWALCPANPLGNCFFFLFFCKDVKMFYFLYVIKLIA